MKSCLIDLGTNLPDFAKDVDILIVNDYVGIPDRRRRRFPTFRWFDFGSALPGNSKFSGYDSWQTQIVNNGDYWLRDEKGEKVLYWSKPVKYLVDIRNVNYIRGITDYIINREEENIILDNMWSSPPTWHPGFPSGVDAVEWAKYTEFAAALLYKKKRFCTNGFVRSPGVSWTMVENVNQTWPHAGRVMQMAAIYDFVIAQISLENGQYALDNLSEVDNIYLAVSDSAGFHKLSEWPENLWGPKPPQ